MRPLFSRDLNIIWLQNLALLTAYTLVGALMPLSIRAAGYSDSVNGLILGTGSLGLLLSLLLMGRRIDQGDPRQFIGLGALFWAASSLTLALVPGLPAILACRFIQGFAYAVFYTAGLVYATRCVPDQMRGSVVGLVEAVGALAISAAPFIAFPIADTWGSTPAYLLAMGFSLFTGVTVLLLPPAGPELSRPVSISHLTPPGVGWLAREAVPAGLVAACLFSVAVAYVNLAPLIALQLGVNSIGIYMSLRAFATVPTRLLSGFIVDHKGPGWAILPGFAIAMLAMALLPILRADRWVYIVPGMFGLGMGLASPALTTWALQKTPATRRAVSINTFTILTEGSGFLSSWLAGAFLQSGSLSGFWFLAALLGAGILGFVRLFERQKRASETEAETGGI